MRILMGLFLSFFALNSAFSESYRSGSKNDESFGDYSSCFDEDKARDYVAKLTNYDQSKIKAEIHNNVALLDEDSGKYFLFVKVISKLESQRNRPLENNCIIIFKDLESCEIDRTTQIDAGFDPYKSSCMIVPTRELLN